jgi:hypothetical protein
VLELGPIFRPVLELGLRCPHTGTVPLRGAQCWNRAPRSGTANLTPNISATLNCTVPIWGRPCPSSSMGQKIGPSSSTGPVPIRGPTYILFHLTKSLGNDQFWWTYNILAFWLISPVFLTVSMVCIGIVRFRGKMSQCTHISPYIVVYTPSCSHIRLPWPKCWSLALFMATHPSFVYKLMTYKTYGMWYVFFLEIQLHLHIHLHIMILHSLITGERESAHLSSHHLHHMVSVFHFIFHMLLMS